MSEKLPGADEQSLVVNNLIAEYMSRTDSGEKITPEQFIAEHSDHAEELSRHFENVNALKELQQTSNQSSSATDQTIIKPDDPTDETTAQTIVRGTADSETSVTRKHTSGSSSTTNIEISETFGRYSIQKVLGQGAMGAVYLAKDTQLDRDVALKIPKFGDLSQVDEEEMLARFYREARAAATLRSANICPVYDVGEIDGQHYITMAYIEGRPLKDFTKSKKAHSEKQIATTIRKLAVGLAQAHKIGVVHRDLKPANIMVDQQGEPVVMDFGLARRSSSDDVQVTQSGAILGTPAYMSPEQVEGDQAAIGPQADIYALGIIMYELITGEMPFKGSLMAILQQIALNNPKKPSELRKDVDPRLEKICLKMMAGDLSKRYRSMNEVAAELQDVLKNPNKKQKKEQSKKTGPKPTSIPSAHEESQPALISVEQPKSYADQLRKKKGKSPSDSKVKSQNKSKIQTASKSGTSRPSRKQLIAGGLGGLILLLGIVFIVRLGKYDVEITLEDPSIQLSVDGKELIIDDGHQIKRLAAGEHQLKLVAGNLVTEVDSFIVTKDGKTALTAKIINGEISVSRNDKKLSPANVAKSSVKPQGSTNINLKNGLVGHWNFEDGRGNQVGDSSGNKNAGRTEGEVSWEVDAAPSPLAGKRSLRFGTGKMRVPASSSLAIDTKSAIAFWCKLDQHASGQSILKSDSFEITSSHQRINFIYRLADSEGRVFQDSGEYKPDDLLGGTWNHVVVNCAGDHTEIWYNGRQYSSGPLNGKLEETSSGYVIGSGVQGSLDDLRIYDRTLTKAEIRQLANVNDIGSLEISDEPLNKFQFDSLNSNATNQPKVHFQSGLSFPSPECYAEVRDLDIDLTQPFCMEAWFDPRNQHGSEIYQRVIANLGPCQLALTNFGDTSLLGNFYQEVEGIVSVQKGAHLTYEQHKSGLTHAALQWTGSEMELFLNGELVKHDYESYGHSEDPLMFAKRVLGESKSPALRIGAPNKAGSEGFLSSSLYEFRLTEGIRYEQNFTPGILTSDAQTKILYDFKPGHGEVLKDSSGNGHHGKIIGAKWVKQNSASTGQQSESPGGLEFDGDDVVHVDSLEFDPAKPFTLEAAFSWEYKYMVTSDAVFAGRDIAVGGDPRGPESGARFAAYSHNHLAFRLGEVFINDGYIPEQHERVHLALVHTGQELLAFRDGKLVGKKPTAGKNVGPGTGRFLIGKGLIGRYEMFRFSTTARYDKDFTPQTRFAPDESTLALFHFDKGHGTVLPDESGNEHNGKIISAKWVNGSGESISAKPDVLRSKRTSRETSLQFSNPEDEVIIPTLKDDTDALTIEVWLQRDETHIAAHSQIVGFGKETAINSNFANALDFRIVNAGYDDGPTQNGSTYGVFHPVHIAGVRDPEKGEIRLYHDGKLMKTSPARMKRGTGSLHIASNEYQWKGNNLGFDHSFSGWIDELRVSKSVRYKEEFTPERRFEKDDQTAALYHFETGHGETLKDSSGNGHDGKILGAKWVKYSASQLPLKQTFLQFDGINDYVEIPTLAFDREKPFTIEGWVKIYDGKPIAENDKAENWDPIFTTNGKHRPRPASTALIFDRPRPGWWCSQNDKESDSLKSAYRNPSGKFGTYQHVAVVYDGQTLSLFEDGKLLSKSSKSLPLPSDKFTEDLKPHVPTIGWAYYRALNAYRYFYGEMRAFRISNEARYSQEFIPENHFDSDGSSILLYDFTEGSGNILEDTSGNGHDGKIIGAKWGGQSPKLSEHALDFSDPRAFVTFPNIDLGKMKPFTLETVVTLPPPITGRDRQEIFITTAPRVGIYVLNDYKTLEINFADQSQKENRRVLVDHELKPNEAVHIATVFDGQQLILFLNGRRLEPIGENVRFKDPAGPPRLILGGVVDQLPGHELPNALKYSYGGLIHMVRVSNAVRYQSDFTPQFQFEPDPLNIGLYHFDEGTGDVLKDASGNGHDGKIVGAKWVKADALSQPEQYSLQFENANDVVTFANPGATLTHPVTVEMWVASDPPPENTRQRRHLASIGLDQGLIGLDLRYNLNEQNKTSLITEIVGPANLWTSGSLPASESDQRGWMHLAQIWTGSELQIYINGRRRWGNPMDGEDSEKRLPENVFAILGGGTDLGKPFQGRIRELRISNSIRYQKNFDLPLPDVPFENDEQTFALYHFNEGTGDFLEDASGKGHDGKIIGAKWVKADVENDGTFASNEPDRRAAEFVLRKGGTVAIVPSREGYGTPIAIKKLDELSHTPFRLVSVEFGNVADVHDGDLQPLEELTHLNQVHLQNTNITNQSLSYLSHISELSNISLYGTKVTDAGLKKLANLELLSTLHMTRTNLEHEGVQGLQSLPSLTTLTLSSITRERLLELAKVSQLRHLGLFSSNLTAVDVANFQKLNPNCRVFIDSKLVGSDPVREVAEWAQQMGATVSVYPMGTFDVAKFNADQSLPEETFDLRAINFHGSDKVTSDDLKKLSICPDLKIVTLDSARITDEEIAQLLGCRALTSVSLVRTDISDASLKALVQLPNLRNLYCSLTGISDTGVSHLRHAQRLHNLELNATKITGKAISHIAEIKTLSNLSIAHNDIHDDDLGPLTMMKSLRELNLTRTKVTAKGVARLKQALPECTIDSDFTDEEIRREMGQSSQPRNNQPTKSETLTRREWSEPVNLGPEFNTSGYDAVSLSADGLTLFVQSERPGGFGQEDLWFSQRASLDEDFTSLENLGPEINSKQNEGGAFLSADGLTLMFASNRPGGQGDNDLWMSKRSDRNAKFSKPVNLGDNINDSMSQGSPQLTADGLTLTLTSNTKLNGWATMQHQRSSLDDPFGESKYVTGGVDGWLSPDGLSLVAVSFQKKSDLQINAGKEDIFLFTRTSVEKGFGKTKFLEGANSSHRDKVPVLSPDGNTIYFVSNRPGGLGNFDIWKSHRVKKGRSPSTSQSAASP